MSKEYKSVPAEFLTFLKDAPVGSGICMCGDNMADHSPHGDHAAVEMWDHTLASWLDDIRALNGAGTLESQALSTALQHKGRYAEMLNDIITASGVAKPTDVSENLQGPDLIAVAISAMWLIQNQRETLDQARQVIEMFMPNVASCFGIDVGALNRTMMNIAMVQRGVAPTPSTLDWAVERWHLEVANRPLVNIHRRALDDTWRQVIAKLGGDHRDLCGPTHDELLAKKDDN